MAEFAVGDRVSFYAKGKRNVGVITGFHYRNFRGRRRELAEMFGGVDGVKMYVIKSDDNRLWKVPVGYNMEIEKKAAMSAAEARSEGMELKSSISSSRRAVAAKRINANFSAAKESDLLSLKDGAEIEVELRDSYSKRTSWYPATFRGFVRGSFNIKYERYGKVRSTAAKYIRIPRKDEK